MSKIVELYDKIKLNFSLDPTLERTVHIELARIVSTCTIQAMGSDEGYCFKFNLPLLGVRKLFKTLNLTVEDVCDAYRADWGDLALTNHMYSDSYYQMLLLLIYFGIMEKKPHFSEGALLIMLFKLWNGRKTKYLKYCDKRIMRYVVSHMCTRRHLFTKYDEPLSMLRNYFMPTLLTKYGPEIKSDPPKKLQYLLSQAWSRLRQQWVINMRTDIKTGDKRAQGGILKLYMDAKEQGLSISTISVDGIGDENSPTYDDYTTSSNRDDIITSTSDFITMNSNPVYSPQFIAQLNKETKVSSKVIEKLLISLHNYQYYDLIHDILSIILSSTNVQQKNDVCDQGYLTLVKRKTISSKNNDNSRRIQILCNKLLTDLFRKHLPVRFNRYSNVQQIQLRSVVINGIAHNLQRNICKLQNVK